MALVNPTISIPTLSRPRDPYSEIQCLSPARSISPSRRDRNLSTDRTIRSVSPDSTLRVIRNSKSLTVSTSEDQLIECIRDTSAADRAFGVSVLRSCKDIRTWAVLIESWEWPGTFAPPPQQDRESIFRDMLVDAGLDESQTIDVGSCGSLPQQVIELRSAELDHIKSALKATDVEPLKRHIARRTKSRSSVALLEDISPIDEFDAIITNAILKALPYLSWLQNLLVEWQTRLLVLRSVPQFLDRLARMEAASHTVSDILRYEKELAEVGTLLDRMLDYLEGRPETLPEEWIDRFEAVESKRTNPSLLQLVPAVPDLSPIVADSGGFDQIDPSGGPVRTVSPVHTIHRPESPILGNEPFVCTPTTVEHTHSSGQSIYEKEMIEQVISEAQDQYFDIGIDEPASAVMTSVPHFPVFLPADFSPSLSPTAAENGDQLKTTAQPYNGALPSLSEEPVFELDCQPDTPPCGLHGEQIGGREKPKQKISVRPMEQASTALSKIFAPRTRSESNSSRSSLRQRMTPSIRSSISSKRTSDISIGHTASMISLTRDKERPAQRNSSADLTASAVSRATAQSPLQVGGSLPDHNPDDRLSSLDSWAPVGSRVAQQDMASPEKVIQADFFERLFVDSLPTSIHPTATRRSIIKPETSKQDDRMSQELSVNTSDLPLHNLNFDQIINTCGPAGRRTSDLIPEAASQISSGDYDIRRHSSTREMPAIPRRASMASIEYFARSQVKTVHIPRPTVPLPDDVRVKPSRTMRRLHKKNMSESVPSAIDLPTRHLGHARSNSASVVPVTDPIGHDRIDLGHLAQEPIAVIASPVPSNLSPQQDAGVFAGGSRKRSDSAVHNFSQPRKVPQPRTGPSFKSGDKIDQRVNVLLQDLPTHIHFAPGTRTQVKAANKIDSAIDSPNPPNSTKHVAAIAKRSQSSHPGITLSCAPDTEMANGYGGKTYYLSLTGSAQPIQLYVRLVGEDERVMVRVGGGWSDLSDYLHQFAQHHGSKTSMDSQITMKQAPNSGEVARSRSTTPTGRATPTGRMTPRGRNTPTGSRSPDTQILARSGTPEAVWSSPDVNSGGSTPRYTYKHTATRPLMQSSPASAGAWGPFPTSAENTSSPRALRARVRNDPGNNNKTSSPSEARQQQNRNGWVEEMLERAKQASIDQRTSAGPTSEPR